MRINKGDLVVVTTGRDAGTTPRRVMRIVDGGTHLVVENVNRAYRHVKKGHPKSPQGGRLTIEMPIDASNVMPYCAKCARGVRVSYKKDEAGSNYRGCRKCGANLTSGAK